MTQSHPGDHDVTGDPTVDSVIASTEALQDRPLAEHVEVFERAHRDLRGALDAGGESHEVSSNDPH